MRYDGYVSERYLHPVFSTLHLACSIYQIAGDQLWAFYILKMFCTMHEHKMISHASINYVTSIESDAQLLTQF